MMTQYKRDLPDALRNASEEDVKTQLRGWMESCGIDMVWENRSPPEGYKTFKTGSRKSPDLLLRFGNEAVLVEVKSNRHHKDVYDAFFQILGYHKDIKTVVVEGEEVTITGFVVATQYSIHGMLFHDDPPSEYKYFSEGRRTATNRGELPRREYALTEMFTRLLWRGIKDGRDSKAFIGSLLSDRIHHGSPNPAILGSGGGKQFFMLMNSPGSA